jgi:hypothetical protein
MSCTQNRRQTRTRRGQVPFTVMALIALAGLVAPSVLPHAQAANNVVLWDTGARLGERLELEDRTVWRQVPADITSLEADPAKASSDPGYYGREYTFEGDLVVENRALTVAFWSAKGRVVMLGRTAGAQAGTGGSAAAPAAQRLLEISGLRTEGQARPLGACRIVRYACDEAIIEVSGSKPAAAGLSALFVFDATPVVEVRPVDKSGGISLAMPLAYAVAPSFMADDLILRAADYPAANTLFVPAESLLLGLSRGEETLVTLTWPKGKQQVRLTAATDAEGARVLDSIEIDHDGKSLFVAPLRAPGIWHREELKPSLLEKASAIAWRRPFRAKWKTQLYEGDVPATFAFREGPGQIWRGVPGSYPFPAWFEGDEAHLHLSKKVPPKGEALIYAVERLDTPPEVLTPVDVLRATLGRAASDAVVDPLGRSLRTHHRRAGAGVHRACTCGVTDAIQAVFEAGEEVEKKGYVKEVLDDMIYFVERHVARIEEYQAFAAELLKLLHGRAGTEAGPKAFVENLEQVAEQMQEEYTVQKENMKTPSHMAELTRRTLALCDKKDPGNVAAFKALLDAWRAMGGSQDYVLARCHMLTRKLYLDAGYGAVTEPKALGLAQEVRERCRQCLRNPDGYEVWANY